MRCLAQARTLQNNTAAAEYCARGGLDSVLAEARRSPAALAELTWKRRLSLVSPVAPFACLAGMQGIRRAPHSCWSHPASIKLRLHRLC